MKKSLCILLSALLALALLPVSALAAKGDAVIGRNMEEDYNDYINSSFVMGDTLCMVGYQNFYTFKVGDADMVAHPIVRPEVEGKNLDISLMTYDGENILALVPVSSVDSETGNSSLTSVEIYKATLGDKDLSLEKMIEVQASDLITASGENSYFAQVNDGIAFGGYLYLNIYNDAGNAEIVKIDLKSGEESVLDIVNPSMMVPYDDGTLMVFSFDYSASELKISCYDPEADSVRELCPPIKRDTPVYGAAYSLESGKLFYLEDGYVKSVANFDFENAQPVAELFADGYYDGRPGRVLPGDFYSYTTYNMSVIRSTNPDEMASTILSVQNSEYSDAVNKAYYQYGNTHGDVAVVLSTTYQQDKEIIESMLNRESGTDIYVMGVQRQAFDALYSRGYMVDLSSSQKISDLVNSVYPGIQSMLTRDGEIVAVPMNVYGWTLGVNYDNFAKIGITEDQIPHNWPEFLDLIKSIEGTLGEEDCPVRLFDSYTTQKNARNMLFNTIMESYQSYLSVHGQEMGYDTPELNGILEKLDALDFAAMGLMTDEESENEENYMSASVTMASTGYEENTNNTLLEISVGCTLGNFYSESNPHLMSISPDDAPILPLQLSVAFVNPFSEHVDQAIEFLETVIDNLDNNLLYNINGNLNEPQRSSYYEENKASIQEMIDQVQKQIETAEPADKPVLEETLKDYQQQYDYNENSWQFSAKDIAWYREHAENLMVQRFNYMYSDENGEIYGLVNQYMDGLIQRDELLRGIDQKLKMMMMEGN